MKFAHIADCHIGSWREQKLRELGALAFSKAIDKCIDEKVDFLLIAGDLFNTSLPGIDFLKSCVSKLKQLKDSDIPIYIVPGSHDFSPSGRTMLDVLEKTGLLTNVVKGDVTEDNKLTLKFTIDPKTGAKITGLLGKKGMLEKSYYESLDKTNLEAEPGYKIFMFHTALTELKPKEIEKMDSSPLSFLPKGFDYYAGGHVHIITEKQEPGYGTIALPGPLFPNNFKEMEVLCRGGLYIVEDNKPEWHPIQVCNVYSINKDCENMDPEQVQLELLEEIKKHEFVDTITTIRLSGRLKSGKPSDIDFKEIFTKLYEKQSVFVMKNINKLTSPEFEELKVDISSVDQIEEKLIKEHLGKIKLDTENHPDETEFTKTLISLLDTEKQEGETTADFENRIKLEINNLLN